MNRLIKFFAFQQFFTSKFSFARQDVQSLIEFGIYFLLKVQNILQDVHILPTLEIRIVTTNRFTSPKFQSILSITNLFQSPEIY